MRSFRGVALALIVGVGVGTAAASADAKQVYRWETEEGVVSFTDELKRVPERYRNQVVQVDTETLSSAKRFSKMATPATALHAEQVVARLESLRAINREETTAEPSGAATVSGVSLSGLRRDGARLRTTDAVVPTLDLGAVADGEAPIGVEEIRVRSEGSPPEPGHVRASRSR